MTWTKIFSAPFRTDIAGAARILNTTEADIRARIANGEFVLHHPTPNVTEVVFHRTDGVPKYIAVVPGAAPPQPPAKKKS
jgi:hypothetical protein